FRSGLEGRAREFNWHNAIGFWSCVPLIVIVTCSLVMSYSWANNLVFRLSGSPVPAPNTSARQADRNRRAGTLDANELNFPSARAENKIPGWRTISFRMPAPSDQNASFTIDAGDGGRPDKRAQLLLRRSSGEEARWENHFQTIAADGGGESGCDLRTRVKWPAH